MKRAVSYLTAPSACAYSTISSDVIARPWRLTRPNVSGARIDPKTDGRPDSRTNVRENASILGNLMSDFDFTQAPRPPMVLPENPKPGPDSIPGSKWNVDLCPHTAGGCRVLALWTAQRTRSYTPDEAYAEHRDLRVTSPRSSRAHR